MAAVPTIGRANRVQPVAAPEADLTRSMYEQYGNQIFRYCLHQLGSREEAEDAVQSTFLNAFRGIKRGIVPELESAWLFSIAHNVCLSRRRSTWRRDRIESPADFDLVEELAPAPSRQADELIGLQDVLEQMPENQRRAILLREWQGLSYREIAEEMELSQAAVETLIFRARRSLAQGLEKPVEQKRRRIRGADLANVLSGFKSLLLGGSAAVKVAAAVAVVSATTVVSAAPVTHKHAHAPAVPAVPSHASPVVPAAPSILTFAPPRTAKTSPVPKHVFSSAHPALPTIAPDPSSATPPPADTTPAVTAPPAETPLSAPPSVQTPANASAPGQTDISTGSGNGNASAPAAAQASPPASTAPPGNASAPGQAKKQDGGGDTSSAASTQAPSGNGNGNASPPGQAKKQDGGGGGDPSSSSSSTQGPSDNGNGNASATTPAADQVSSFSLSTPSSNGNANGNGNANPPGQAKKQDDAPAPLVIPPVAIPGVDPQAVVPTDPTPPPVQQTSGDTHGNGNGNANGGGKGH